VRRVPSGNYTTCMKDITNYHKCTLQLKRWLFSIVFNYFLQMSHQSNNNLRNNIIAWVVLNRCYPKSHYVVRYGSSRVLVWTSSGHITWGVLFNSKNKRKMITWPKKHQLVDFRKQQFVTSYMPHT